MVLASFFLQPAVTEIFRVKFSESTVGFVKTRFFFQIAFWNFFWVRLQG